MNTATLRRQAQGDMLHDTINADVMETLLACIALAVKELSRSADGMAAQAVSPRQPMRIFKISGTEIKESVESDKPSSPAMTRNWNASKLRREFVASTDRHSNRFNVNDQASIGSEKEHDNG